jgi:hypothetical protein
LSDAFTRHDFSRRAQQHFQNIELSRGQIQHCSGAMYFPRHRRAKARAL